MTRRMSAILDCLRWVSAMTVLIDHTSNLMLTRLINTPAPFRSAALYLWVFSAGFGHQAVTVFFVLSGFLVGGPLVGNVKQDGQIPWKKYFVDRMVRIQLVLIPALIATYVFDKITFHVNPEWVREFVQDHTSFQIFLGNVLSLQNFYIFFFGSDGPIGTLAIEMWFYISFPLFLAAFCRKYSTSTRLGLVTLAIAVNVALGVAQPAYLLGFIVWGIGVLARVWKGPVFKRPLIPTALFILVLLVIRAVMRRDMSENIWYLFLADLLLAVSLYLLLASVLRQPEAQTSVFLAAFHKRIASFSYSLYAVHMPLLFLLSALSKLWFGFGTVDVVQHSSQWLLVLTTMAICITFAYLFSLATERHTFPLRKWVFARIGG